MRARLSTMVMQLEVLYALQCMFGADDRCPLRMPAGKNMTSILMIAELSYEHVYSRRSAQSRQIPERGRNEPCSVSFQESASTAFRDQSLLHLCCNVPKSRHGTGLSRIPGGEICVVVVEPASEAFGPSYAVLMYLH